MSSATPEFLETMIGPIGECSQRNRAVRVGFAMASVLGVPRGRGPHEALRRDVGQWSTDLGAEVGFHESS